MRQRENPAYRPSAASVTATGVVVSNVQPIVVEEDEEAEEDRKARALAADRRSRLATLMKEKSEPKLEVGELPRVATKEDAAATLEARRAKMAVCLRSMFRC